MEKSYFAFLSANALGQGLVEEQYCFTLLHADP
jgi:hypothetical protein